MGLSIWLLILRPYLPSITSFSIFVFTDGKSFAASLQGEIAITAFGNGISLTLNLSFLNSFGGCHDEGINSPLGNWSI